MLHLITEENSELKNKSFPIPDGVRKLLRKTLNDYNGDKTVDGYKRLKNILSMKTIGYHEMKRIKNFFDNYGGTEKSTEFILNGGEQMKNWVNSTLEQARKSVEDFKQAKKDSGMDNAFRKPHEKDRQNRKKNKPTQVRFNVTNKNILNNNTLNYLEENINLTDKNKKTIFITEQQVRMLKEAIDDKFTLEELSSLPTFKARNKYCMEHLGRHIGKGSSRATFQIDDETVLKLAWNNKGIAQNIEEERAYGGDIFPQVKNYDQNGLWLTSEYVLPAKKKDFIQCFNMTWEKFCDFILSCGRYRFGKNYSIRMDEDEWLELLENDENLQEFDEYIGNYGTIVIGDMIRICNYGLTKRNGEAHLVLLDSGLTDYVWNKYYK